MEENRNDRHDRNDNRPYRQHNRDRNNRYRHPREGGGNQGSYSPRRAQRPLLTSSINGAGLTLIALLVLDRVAEPILAERLALAVCAFSASALISYIAQRVKPLIVELVSDLFFLIGALIVLYVGLRLGGFISF